MLSPNQIADIEILGSDTLREYRDAILRVLAERESQAGPLVVVRNNVLVSLEHRAGREGGYDTQLSFVLHPRQSDCAAGVMLNRETTRDHLWMEARWL